jgi:rod shape-determining protein MreC
MSTTTLGEENRQLRGLLSLASRMGPAYVAASVIRPGTPGSESMFLLDVGTEEGVRVNAPIISRFGLVGVVREAGPESSIGMDWTDPDFRASAMSLDGSASGLVLGRRGDFREQDELIFDGTRYHTRLVNGTDIVTSGLGGVFPRGIPIGRVGGLAEADAGWRKSYWLEPMVDPGSVTHVLVATGSLLDRGDLTAVWPPDSILTLSDYLRLERAREDSLRALTDSVRALRELLRGSSGGEGAARPDTTDAGEVR